MLSHPLCAPVYSSADSGAHGAALRWEVSLSTGAETTDSRGTSTKSQQGTGGQAGFRVPFSLLKAILPGPMRDPAAPGAGDLRVLDCGFPRAPGSTGQRGLVPCGGVTVRGPLLLPTEQVREMPVAPSSSGNTSVSWGWSRKARGAVCGANGLSGRGSHFCHLVWW